MALDPMMAMMMMGGMGGNSYPEEAAGNPFGGGGGGTTSMARQLAPLRAMSYINRDSRMMGPQARAPRQSSAASQFMPGMAGMDGQDYSQYTFDPAAHAAASQFLGQYGLAPLDPSQVKQNTILPNSGFFGNHPRLSGMLEGGIYGAAASRGSNTWGEGIQSVADSLIAGPRMRAAAYSAQFEKPFQAAHMLEQAEDLSQKRELTEAQIQHERALTQALREKPDPMPHAVTGLSSNDSAFVTYDNAGQPTLHENPYFDKSGAKSANTPGVAPLLRYFRQMGVTNPDAATSQQWKKASDMAKQEQLDIASARTGADTEARIRAEYKLGDRVPVDVKSQAQQAAKGWLDPKNKEIRFSIAKSAMDAGKDLPSEEAIDQEINRRNSETNEKIHNVYQDFMNAQSPMPSR